MFDFEQALVAVTDVSKSLFLIILAIIALESFLYVALMATKGDRKALPAAAAAPAILAGGVLLTNEITTALMVILAVALAILIAVEALLYLRVAQRREASVRLAVPIMLLAPAIIGIAVLYVYPLYYEFSLSFTKMNIRNFVNPGILFGLTAEGTPFERLGAEKDIFIGLQNYIDVFTKPVLKQTGFWQLLTQTIIWTVTCIFFHVVFGIGLALMLNRKLRGRTIYRALLILPWAIPIFISLQIWRTEFNFQFGAVNQVLALFGIPPQQWMSDPIMNFAAMILTNIWLGVPFMMVITLGGLQSISSEYYEASEIDGANGRQQFFGITLPLLRPVLIPAVLLGVFLTFNNIMVPFFINQNELETSDILVTALYRAAFQFSRYGFAAAFAFVVFAILLVFTIFYVRQTKILKGTYES
jgi:arabinogalactan oligomer/maltooligosaccharide transport system permease protein